MTQATITSVAATMKDFFPRPGDWIKQYVVDTRREAAWDQVTCPQFLMEEHLDNSECDCVNSMPGSSTWLELRDAECDICNERYEALRSSPHVTAWLAEKAKRPPIERDRAKLSDEIAPDVSLESHPLLAMIPRDR